MEAGVHSCTPAEEGTVSEGIDKTTTLVVSQYQLWKAITGKEQTC